MHPSFGGCCDSHILRIPSLKQRSKLGNTHLRCGENVLPAWKNFELALSQILRQRRIDSGYTQDQLAQKSGFQRSYIADIERDARQVSLKYAWKIAQTLEINLAVIIDEAEKSLASQDSRVSQLEKVRKG